MSSLGEDASRVQCTACRGTGKVISALNGEPHEVTCPWCGGDGRFHPGRDAQEAVAEQSDGADAPRP